MEQNQQDRDEIAEQINVLLETTFKGGGSIAPIKAFAQHAASFREGKIGSSDFRAAVKTVRGYLTDGSFAADSKTMSKFARKKVAPAVDFIEEHLPKEKGTTSASKPIAVFANGRDYPEEQLLSPDEQQGFLSRLAKARGTEGEITAASSAILLEMRNLLDSRRKVTPEKKTVHDFRSSVKKGGQNDGHGGSQL